jgi:6-phosphofructokinase 1
MRIGILTAGGDCPGLNAVIRSAAKSLLLRHGAQVVGVEDGFLGAIECRFRPLDYRAVSGLLGMGGTVLGTDSRVNPFAYVGRGGADVTREIVANCRGEGIDGLIVLGGDGTMRIAERLDAQGLPIVGIPKTIDNDVPGTDRTVGFDTAVGVVAEAVERIQTTAQSHHRVQVVETMGRLTGWIALHGGVEGGADVILLPEVPHALSEVVRVCRVRQERGQRFTVVVIAEGAREDGAEAAPQPSAAAGAPPPRLGGVGAVLAARLEESLGMEVRATILGHVQRGGPPSAQDRLLATVFGERAATMAAAGRFGRMVALHQGRFTDVPLSTPAAGSRTVPLDSAVLRAAWGVGTSFGKPGLVPPQEVQE